MDAIITALAIEFKNRQAKLNALLELTELEKRARQFQHNLSKHAVFNALSEVYGHEAAEKFWKEASCTS